MRTFRQLVADYGEFIDSTYLPLMYSPPLPPSLQSAQLEQSEEGRQLLQWQAAAPVQLLSELFESEEVKVHFLARMTVLGFARPVRAGLDLPLSHPQGGGAHLRRRLAAACSRL